MRKENSLLLNPNHLCYLCDKKETALAKIEYNGMLNYQILIYSCTNPECSFFIDVDKLTTWGVVKNVKVLDNTVSTDKINKDKSLKKLRFTRA